jgi:glycosyltransferase involved in cell wall biosynthesis
MTSLRIGVTGGVFGASRNREAYMRSAPEYRQLTALEPLGTVVTLGPVLDRRTITSQGLDVAVANHLSRTTQLLSTTRIPFVYVNHDGLTARPWLRPDRARHAATLRWVLARARVAVALSHEEELALRRLAGTTPVRLLPQALDPVAYVGATRRSNRGARPRVVFVGHFTEDKGLFVLLEALALLESLVGLEVELSCVGFAEPHEARRVDALARRLGLRSHLRIEPGGLPLEALVARLAASDLYVAPSFAEAQSTLLEEALAVGTDVVASAVGSAPERLPPSALHAPGNALELACRMGEHLCGTVPPVPAAPPSQAAFDAWCSALRAVVLEAL